MLLAVDVGNSHTMVGVFEGDELTRHWLLSTDAGRTGDELALQYTGLLAFAGVDLTRDVDGLVCSSVVPAVTEAYRDLLARHAPLPAVFVEPGVRTGIPLRYENPREIGADRIANAVAAEALHGGPAIVVDFGTSTNFDAIGEHGEFLGGVIAPGVQASTDALIHRTARLPKVETLQPPTTIGRTTVQALQSGIVFGFAGQVDAIVERIADELPGRPTVISTGSLAESVRTACRRLDAHDPWLTLKGLRLIWDRNG